MTLVDVVIVSFRSRRVLRRCVEPLVRTDEISVIVVDNASDDDSLEVVADLPVTPLALERNVGFAAGCNAGWAKGAAPYVLFLNPDARIDVESVRRLAAVLETDSSVGAAAPIVRSESGALECSQRRFPRTLSTFAQALFVHRLLPRAPWSDEVVRDEALYLESHSVDWVSGACIVVRRDLLERLGGWDERFFMYCEDADLCKRIHEAGFDVRFEPGAEVVHTGGTAAPRAELLPVLSRSRVLYAQKHSSRPRALADRIGIRVGNLTHALLSSRGRAARRGYLRAASSRRDRA